MVVLVKFGGAAAAEGVGSLERRLARVRLAMGVLPVVLDDDIMGGGLGRPG